MPPPAIRGLKQSGELALIRMGGAEPPDLACLLRRLAAARLNLVLFSAWRGPAGPEEALLGLEAPAAGAAFAICRRTAEERGLPPPALEEGLAALTIFPKGGDLTLPAAARAELLAAGVAVRALATSLSAVVALVGLADLPRAREVLARAFALPADCSPPEERVRVVQTPAGGRP